MELRLPTAPKGYKSGSQIIRRVTEEWGRYNLYCPACDSDKLSPTPNNTKAIDYICPNCEQPFQLKSCSKWDGNRVMDAGYDAMISAIRSDSTPNLLVLHYSDWYVMNVLLVPYFFFTEHAIEKRPPLAETARRAGWVGCNILLSHIPADGRIRIVDNGTPADPVQVRESFRRIQPIASLDVLKRGWTLDVLNVVRALNKLEFTLAEVYTYESQLSQAHPENRHIRDKIRQQLQVLRDLGFLEFLGRGRYVVVNG